MPLTLNIITWKWKPHKPLPWQKVEGARAGGGPTAQKAESPAIWPICPPDPRWRMALMADGGPRANGVLFPFEILFAVYLCGSP